MQNKYLADIILINKIYSNTIEEANNKSKVDVSTITPILSSVSNILTNNESTAISSTNKKALNKFCDLYVYALLNITDSEQCECAERLLQLIVNIIHNNREDLLFVPRKLIMHLLMSLDYFNTETRRSILNCLEDLRNKSELYRKNEINQTDYGPNNSDLSVILDQAVFGEVSAFLDIRSSIVRDIEPHIHSTASNRAKVYSIGSKKGGVGKSTIAMLIALKSIKEGKSTCIIDLDLTGPVWQYLLFPNRNQPKRFLNDLFEVQNIDRVDFGNSTAEDILGCISVAHEGKKQELGLLTFADLPKTNRLLQSAISLRNNHTSYASFLKNIISVISEKFDTIIIDNSPGFDSCSLLSFAVTGQLFDGVNVVVSSAQKHDIYGTFIDMSEFKLLGLNPPLWVINKADKKTFNWLSKNHSTYEIINKSQGYDVILSSYRSRLLKHILKTRGDIKSNNICIGFDDKFKGFMTLTDNKNFTERLLSEVQNWSIYKELPADCFDKLKYQ